ncbi:MAG: U32 family peptidase [Oscillospiraceae bacterium]|nr:U32 family peptidase [Oscillospiraceae bacterium]
MITENKPELLAPCGSMESLTAALKAGCDAVYFGGRLFSARQNAENFSHENILEAVSLCHRRGVRLYQAINIAVFDSELPALADEIKFACEAGVDGLIIQDRAVEKIVRDSCPTMPIHASTQMTLHFSDGVLWASEHGYSRVVLSRELSRDIIRKLSTLGVETEIFVHGALCMSVSGQCFLSAMIGSRSANRGLCAGACRLPFSSADKSAGKPKDKYALSLKDLTLIDDAEELKSIGASSLKIEGRMKRPEYVSAATGEFRAALDGSDYDYDLLRSAFSRSGFTDGYFSGRRDSSMFGARSYEDVTDMTASLTQIHEKYKSEYQRFSLSMTLTVRRGENSILKATDGTETVTITGTIPQEAINRPLSVEAAVSQLGKLGGTLYRAGEITAEIEPGLMLPLSELNSLRRQAVEALDNLRQERLTVRKPFTPANYLHEITKKPKKPVSYWVSVENLSQLEKIDCERVIIPLSLANEYISSGRDPKKAIVTPPRFTLHSEKVEADLVKAKSLGFESAMATNSGYVRMLPRLGFGAIGGFGLNITNSLSAHEYERDGLTALTLSFELKTSQLSSIRTTVPKGAVLYGKLPLMVMANCPIKAETGCKACSHTLTDRTGTTFPVNCHMLGGYDYNELLNSKTLYLPDKQSYFDIDFGVLMFTDESPEEVRAVLEDYRAGVSRRDGKAFTNGLYFRGVI